MSSFTWLIPSESAVTADVPDGSAPSTATRSYGHLDQYLDPVTLDYVDTEDGEWWETEDSRTAVMLQLSIRYGEWWADPEAGSRLPARLEEADPVTLEEAVDETLRALQVLVDDGIISDLSVTGDPEGDGAFARGVLLLSYLDRASGRPVDLVYSPFRGG